MFRAFLFIVIVFCSCFLFAEDTITDTVIIDVIIPCTNKDLDTLIHCIRGIRENCVQVRRIIVVSATRLTDEAEWFAESNYPFNKNEVALKLRNDNVNDAISFIIHPNSRLGWYYQQLLKLYSPFVISNISSNVLILDSDTIFLNPVEFISPDNVGLYNTGDEWILPYFVHGERLIPEFRRIFPHYSGICHHMLFQKHILEDLFKEVESNHKMEFWKAFCLSVDPNLLSGASEYELYFNYIFSKEYPVKIRPLKWKNTPDFNAMIHYKNAGYHYISCHAWMRQ